MYRSSRGGGSNGEAVGLRSIGIEIDPEYYTMAVGAIPKLAALEVLEPGSKPVYVNDG
jgi:hypothetical protein